MIHNLWCSLKGSSHKDSCQVNMVARTTHTLSTLEIDATGLGYQTHHTGRPRQMWASIILLEKCCVHMPCSLNDQNDLILQFMQVLLVCYGAHHQHQSNKPMLTDCIPHGAFCRVEWHLHDSVWICRCPEPHVLLTHIHKSIEVEICFLIKPQAVYGSGLLLHKL